MGLSENTYVRMSIWMLGGDKRTHKIPLHEDKDALFVQRTPEID